MIQRIKGYEPYHSFLKLACDPSLSINIQEIYIKIEWATYLTIILGQVIKIMILIINCNILNVENVFSIQNTLGNIKIIHKVSSLISFLILYMNIKIYYS